MSQLWIMTFKMNERRDIEQNRRWMWLLARSKCIYWHNDSDVQNIKHAMEAKLWVGKYGLGKQWKTGVDHRMKPFLLFFVCFSRH